MPQQACTPGKGGGGGGGLLTIEHGEAGHHVYRGPRCSDGGDSALQASKPSVLQSNRS